MAEKNDLKSFKCQFESDLGHMNPDDLFDQLAILDDYYRWSIEELNKITKKYIEIEENPDFDLNKEDKLEALTKQFMELDRRHQANEALFKKLILESRQYFLDKYNLDILKLVNKHL